MDKIMTCLTFFLVNILLHMELSNYTSKMGCKWQFTLILSTVTRLSSITSIYYHESWNCDQLLLDVFRTHSIAFHIFTLCLTIQHRVWYSMFPCTEVNKHPDQHGSSCCLCRWHSCRLHVDCGFSQNHGEQHQRVGLKFSTCSIIVQRLSWVAPNSTGRNRSFIFTCSQSTAPTWVCSNTPHRACVVPLKHDELFRATLLLTAVSRSSIRSALFYRSWAASAEHCGMLVTAVLPSQTEIHRQVMQSLALCFN